MISSVDNRDRRNDGFVQHESDEEEEIPYERIESIRTGWSPYERFNPGMSPSSHRMVFVW